MSEFWGALGGIGSAVGGIGGLVSAIGNVDIGNKNLQMMQRQAAWDRQVQAKTWEREDTAVQRRTADLKAAGLNPVLAAGGAAQTSAPVKITVPQRDNLPDFGKVGSSISDVAQRYLELTGMKETISNTIAQRKLIEANVAKADAEAGMAKYTTDYYTERGLPPPPAQGHIWKELLPWGQQIQDALHQMFENVKPKSKRGENTGGGGGY